MSESRYYSEFLRDANSKGKVEGKAEGKAEAVLRVLETRGVAVDERQRARIEGCGDPEQLDEWLVRAVLATTADEVFDRE
ncbi:hypothetical protein [Actinomadura sediminis]|uniref:DUF4351 domain-containing protein n=1 Tax=Actinomadura sediminis TaxID=1038904 RepID=A0ABW3EQD3_9ACTN